MVAATDSTTPTRPELEPLTERILDALPGRRVVWIALWALLPPLNAAVNLLLDEDTRSAVWEQSRLLVFVNYVALTIGVAVSLWGAGRIARRLEELRPATSEVLALDGQEPFREMNSSLAVVLVSVAAAIAFAASTVVSDGWAPGLVRGATWLLLGIPIWSFLWTYASLQLGLDRLGRERVLPTAVNVDPGLGLRQLGAVAFMGLWMLLIWLVPLVLTGLPDIVGVVIGLLAIGGALGVFFLSLFRLHRQMVEIKAEELEIARDLYARAYEPVRAAPSLETLDEQRALLGAADSLEKRARGIHEWPIDEGTLARVLTIVTSVLAMTIARLILDPLGL